MIRRNRPLRFESLENREMLAITGNESTFSLGDFPTPSSDFSLLGQLNSQGPSANEQEMLELINRMRMDPQGELHRLIRSFSPLQGWDPRVTTALNLFSYPNATQLINQWASLAPTTPLAWNTSIAVAAANHSYLMMISNTQSHQIVDHGELPLLERMIDAGFDPLYKYDESSGDYIAYASENIYAYGRDQYGDFSPASYTHAAFAVDWGVETHDHRNNIMNPLFTDVGVSMLQETNPSTAVGPWLTTVDFGAGKSNQTASGGNLLGVIYDDINASGYYEAGEGIADALITVTRLDSLGVDPIQFEPFQAGGYQIFLENGMYSVSVSFNGGETITKYVSVRDQNVKVDFTLQDGSNEVPTLDLNGAILDGIDYDVVFQENGSAAKIVSDITVLDDPDSSRLFSATVTLKNRPDGPNEFITVDTEGTGLRSSYDSSTGVLLLFGDATVADYLRALKTLEYGNVSQRADLSDRTIEISVSDGSHESPVAKTTVRITQTHFETITLSDVQLEEGDRDGNKMVFWISLSDVPRCNVVLEYQFLDGTAINGVNYFASNSSLVIAADQTQAKIEVEIPGDYFPGSDLDFSLNITNVIGANITNRTAIGTIWDDDTPQILGQIARWHVDHVELADGHRRLYAFTPAKSGTVVWEALLAEGSFADIESMSLYQDTHEGEPLVSATEFRERARLEWDVVQGQTYLLLLKGDVNVESLRMSQTFVKVDDEKQEVEIELDPSTDDTITLDLDHPNYIEYNGVYIPSDSFGDYRVRFSNVDPRHLLRIFGYGSTIAIDPDNSTIPNGGGGIDIGDFKRIEYDIPDGNTVVNLRGTSGNDTLLFRDDVVTLTTADHVIYTVRGAKLLNVHGGGGQDVATLYDTIENDTVTFESDMVRYYGGGNTKYRFNVEHFTSVDVVSFYGGKDKLNIVNDSASTTYLSEWLVRRSGTDPVYSDQPRNFTAQYFSEIAVADRGETRNHVVWEPGNDTNLIYASPGRVQITGQRQSIQYSIFGIADIKCGFPQGGSMPLILYYEGMLHEQEPTWDSRTGSFWLPASVRGNSIERNRLEFQTNIPGVFYYNGVSTDIATIASESGFSLASSEKTVLPDFSTVIASEFNAMASTSYSLWDEIVQEQFPSRNESMAASTQRIWESIWSGEESSWDSDDVSIRNRETRPVSLEVADIALLFGDWDDMVDA